MCSFQTSVTPFIDTNIFTGIYINEQVYYNVDTYTDNWNVNDINSAQVINVSSYTDSSNFDNIIAISLLNKVSTIIWNDTSVYTILVNQKTFVPLQPWYDNIVFAPVEEIMLFGPGICANEYGLLITQEFQTPNFLALVNLLTEGFNEVKCMANFFPSYFDLDIAEGQQLDVLGEWIGISRIISPGISTAFFSWGTPGLGWGQGYWAGVGSSAGITSLPDDVYRTLLYTKIALNHWDGSIPGIVNGLKNAFPTNTIVVTDNQDMSMVVDILGVVTPLTKALFAGGYFDIVPAGVSITYDTNTIIFGWGLETIDMKGWSQGSWLYPLV